MTATLPRTHLEPEELPGDGDSAVLVRWHEMRRIVGLTAFSLAIVAGVILMWPAMALVAFLGAAIAIDATFALRSNRSAVVPTLVSDILLTGVALVAASVPPAAIGVVVAYYVILVAVIGSSRAIWPIGLLAVVIGVAASFASQVTEADEQAVERSLIAGVIVVAVFGLSTIVLVREFRNARTHDTESAGRKIEIADSIAEASMALVAEDESLSLALALEAIRSALGASVVFAERNFEDPEHGLTAVVVDRATVTEHPHPSIDLDARVPWASAPGARSHLSGGAPFFYRIEEARGTSGDRGGEGGLLVEVDVPIEMHGEWVGVIGAADTDGDRVWRSDDLVLLRAIANLTGAFWQREGDAKVRDSLIGSLDGRLRFEEALARASQALLGERSSELLPALESVGTAADVEEVFVTSTESDADGEPTAVVIAAWSAPGVEPAVGSSTVWAYADQSSTRDVLQRGEMAHVEDAVGHQLVAGIEVGGAWFGSVGFVSGAKSRHWTQRDESFLRTIADILGAFYERSQNRARLEASLSSKDQLIASVSHELRSPLTVVVGLVDELRSGGDEFPAEERDQLLEMVGSESAEMADLVEDLLIAARSESGDVPVFPERVDLALLTQSVVAHLVVPDHCSVAVDDVASVAYADPVRVRQIVRNLMTNAFRYGGSTITARFGSTDGESYMEIHDDGQGIPAGDQATIFEAYGRSSSGRSSKASVGLGLTLSRRLAELMGGRLTYVDGQGCTFRLVLPLPSVEDR